jgi:MFS family permease
MYQNDLFERLRGRAARSGASKSRSKISPIVWALGLTSFLTDISSEMVTSVLPVYLFNYLRLSPLQFGAVDAVYNGLSVALIAIVVGIAADRSHRHKEAAAAGYSLSALCKLLLIAAGGTWAGIMAAVGLDRLGKGIRTAPRDAMISLSTSKHDLGLAFGVHRAMDSAGALLGPVVAFAFLIFVGSNSFDELWMASFLVAITGVAALWLFVPRIVQAPEAVNSSRLSFGATLRMPGFIALLVCGTLLAMCTVSDAFLYVLIQEKSDIGIGYVPLFYVATAATFMLFAVSAGKLADRFGLQRMFILGYCVLVVIYALLLSFQSVSELLSVACIVLLGLFYAATEGVLMAMASHLVPAGHRATGLALLLTGVGLAKFTSSLLFGWLWQSGGIDLALAVFVSACVVMIVISHQVLGRFRYV